MTCGARRTALAILATVVVAAALSAHPAVGIVCDAQGNVYYSDLNHVWCVSPGSAPRIVVPRVHTHELWLDANGHLHGEHLWYEGDATGKWGHYVWRLTRDGTVERIVPATEGFLRDYSFVRDGAGRMYWHETDASRTVVIRRRTPDGAIATLQPQPALRDPRWLAASPNGTLYTMSRGDLVRIAPDGVLTVFARRLAGGWLYVEALDRHDVQGLCADDAGNVWAAVSSQSVVKKISADGTIAIFARSPAPWTPSGVTTAPDGRVWVLETSRREGSRVRQLGPDGREIPHSN